MSTVKIPIEATFAAGAVEAELDKLTQKINQLGNSFAKVSGEQWNPISKVAVDDIKKMADQFERLKKGAPNVRDALNKAGQGKADYFDVDWDKVFTSAITRSATRYGAFRKTIEGVGDGGFSPIRPNPSPGAGGAGGGNGGGNSGNGGGSPPGGGNTPGTTWGSAGRRILGSGMRAMGGAGGAAADAMEGAAGGMAGPLILADLAAKGIGAVVGMIKDKVSAAYQLDVGYDTLKRQLGDVGVGFERLKVSLENTADANGATLQETQAVASAFAKAAGVFGEQAKNLAGDAGVAIGFARSFGIDPTTAGQFFGQMRKMGASSDENGSKRLALMIGESVAKAGISTQMPEVLAALSDFTQQQTRMGMSGANQAAYLGEFAGLAGSHTPGTDAQSIANMISTANAAMQHGGNLGEASQNLMYRALGHPNGLTPEQTLLLQEQGLYGTAASEFGKGSLYSRYAAKFGGLMPSLGASSTKMNYQAVLENLKGRYSGEQLINAFSGVFGLSQNQSMQMLTSDPTDVSGVAKRMQRLGLDMTKLNANGIEKTTGIEANKNLSETQKDAQIKDAYDKNQESTDASRARDAMNGIQNEITKQADKTIPLLSSMLSGIMYLAGNGGKKSQRQIESEMNAADNKDAKNLIDQNYDPQIDALKGKQKDWANKRNALQSIIASKYSNPAAVKKAQADLAALGNDPFQSQIDAIAGQKAKEYAVADATTAGNNQSYGLSRGSKVSQDFLAGLDADDKAAGMPAGWSRGILGTENAAGDPNATSPMNSDSTYDRGLFQINDAKIAELRDPFRKLYGRSPDPYNPEDSRLLKNMIEQRIAKKTRDAHKGARYWNRGENSSDARLNDSSGNEYDSRFSSHFNAPIPSDADTRAAAAKASVPPPGSSTGGSTGPQEMRFTFTHLDAKGKPIPTIKTAFNMPNAQGAN